MSNVIFKIDESGRGGFYIMEGDEQLGEMSINITGNRLTAFHTEVASKAEGKGYAKMLLQAMVNHARSNNLKVRPVCAFVHAQFRRHPEDFADIWLKEEQSQ